MRLVLDTNIIFSALIKDSITREILVSAPVDFRTPEYAFLEIDKHMSAIVRKAGVKAKSIAEALDIIKDRVEVVSMDLFAKYIPEAYDAMKALDPNDTPFLALALSFTNDGIWSDDKAFKKQALVPSWTTKEIIEKLY